MSRRPVVLSLVAAIVVLLVANGWMWRSYDGVEAEADARSAATDAALASVPLVLSYSFSTVDQDLARAADELTGRFRSEFVALATGTISPAAKKDKITTSAVATEVGVVDVKSADEVNLLVFVNQTTTNRDLKQPTQTGTRITVTMRKDGDNWRISALDPA